MSKIAGLHPRAEGVEAITFTPLLHTSSLTSSRTPAHFSCEAACAVGEVLSTDSDTLPLEVLVCV